MKITAFKTHKISVGENIFKILDDYLPQLKEESVVAITSKIIALCQKDVIKKVPGKEKKEFIPDEADFYLGDSYTMKYGQIISIKNHTLTASAGIDESNSGGYYTLWPKNIQEITDKIWVKLRDKHDIKKLGVIITDSRTLPLRWGVTGIALSWCGLEPLKSYIGKTDIYGRMMHAEQTSIIDSLATAATVTTGEGNEQQPLALIEDVDFVTFQNRVPTHEEIANLYIEPEDDLFSPLLNSVKWEKGKEKTSK
jgi:putative folate metabolism gamma-glutamate ligase